MTRILFFTLFLVGSFAAHAQENGAVSLSVVDDEGNPVPDVSLRLLNTADSSLAKIGITDSAGNALLEDIKPGHYFIQLSSFEYRTQNTSGFSVNANTPEMHLPVIHLEKSSTDLAEVTIVNKKPFIERQLDKIVLNIENSIAATGTSVLDVLERAPGVVISNGTSINLRGKSGVKVMIDGKPSPLSGEDLINYLRTIPSVNIEKIEIITNPSARYDAAGNAGIINIKFKKDQRQGFNGNVSLTDGQGMYNKPGAGTNLNFRKNKWNVFANYSRSHPTGFTRFYINRKFFDQNHSVLSVFDQTSFIKQKFDSHNAKLGVDYYASPRTVIGVMFNGNRFTQGRNGFTHANITNSEDVLQYTTETLNLLDEKRFNGFGNVNLKQTFDSTGKELTVDLDYGQFNSGTNQHFTSNYYDALAQPFATNKLKTHQAGNITIESGKADYTNPLKNGKFEVGVKSSYVRTDNDIKFYDLSGSTETLDSSRSNHFIYDEYINAGYANYARQMNKTEMQLGLRAEQTHTKGKQMATGETFERKYLYLFPSLFVNRKLNDNHQLSLSYSRRIDRPSYQQLNPFRVFVDPYTYVVGDPQLRPVLTHSVEFAHTFKGTYITSVGYTHSRQVITDVFIQDDNTHISYQIPANLQNYDQVYLSLSLPFGIKEWFNSNFITSAYYNNYTSQFQGGHLVNGNFSFDVNMTNSFIIGKKGWSAELSGYYQGQQAWGLFVIKNLAQITTGIQKSTKNKMTTFKLAISDIFYTNRIAVVVKYQNQDFHTQRNWDSRVLTFSLTQRFGKNTVAQARRRNTSAEDVKSRAN